MKTRKLIMTVISYVLIIGLTLNIAVTAFSDSAVTDADWIAAPSNELVKCSGEGCDHTECDYVYSFAVVGDTQNLNYIDAQNYVSAKNADSTLTYASYNSHMKTLYNWILNNKNSKNIQYVMGLGDITQSFNVNQTYYDEEWALAKEAVSLLDGNLGYSLVRGNHDVSSGLNGAFGNDTRYYNDLKALAAQTDSSGRPMAGFLDESKIEDTYRKIAVGNDKYIIFTLDYYPTEACLTWIEETLTANADYQAIITIHAFLGRDGSLLDDIESTTPSEVTGEWVGTDTGGNVEPRVLWEDCLSKHANVKMILAGHIDVDDVVVNQLKGDNGNTVTCMLIDGQTIDQQIEPVGLVTMFYVSADGKVVNIEHISTVREAAGKDAYLKEKNQFELTVDYGTDGWTQTDYGYIPTKLYNDYAFHVLLDDDSDSNTDASYFGYYNSWGDTLSAIHAFNGIGGAAVRQLKTYYIVMSKNADGTKRQYTHASGLPSNASGKNPGKMVIDLGGNEFNVDGGAMLPYYNSLAQYQPSVEIKNGTVNLSNSAMLVVLQNSIKGNDSVIDLAFSNLNVNLKSAKAHAIGNYDGTAGYKSVVNCDVNNCTFDSSSVGSVVTLFEINETNDNNDVNLTLNGGSLISDTAVNLIVMKGNSGDKLRYGLGFDNKYPTLTLNESGAELTGIYVATDESLLRYKSGVLSGSKYLYEMEAAPAENTPYGQIATDSYPASQYPFALFVNGKFAGAFTTWVEFCNNVGSYDTTKNAGAVLYLRDNYTTSVSASKKVYEAEYLTIDLNEKTLKSTKGSIFNFIVPHATQAVTNIAVKNGTITTGASYAPVIAYNRGTDSTGTVAAATYTANLDFEGVTFNATSDFKGRMLAEAWKDGTAPTKSNLNFNNCTFDITTGTVSKLFQLEESNSQNKVDVAVNINGGKLVANRFITIASFSAERESGKGTPDTLTLGKHDGKAFTLVMPSTVNHPTTSVATTAGALYPIETADDGTNSSYDFKSITTPYGDISTNYLSEVDYPFVIFKEGNFVRADKSWALAVSRPKDMLYGISGTEEKMQILLRRDYTTTTTSTSNDDTSKLWRYVGGEVTVDLGGNTLTSDSYIPFYFNLVDTVNKSDSSVIEQHDINVIVKNGSLVSLKQIAAINRSNNLTKEKKVNITFDTVKIISSSGASQTTMFTSWNDGSDVNIPAVMNFNNCTFDLTSAKSNLVVFSLAEATNLVDVAVCLRGGSITAGTLGVSKLYALGTGDLFALGKYNDAYPTIKLTGSGTIGGEFVTEDGKTASYAYNEASGLYELSIAEMLGMYVSEDGKTLEYVFPEDVPEDCKNAAVIIAVYDNPGVLSDVKIGYLTGNVATATVDTLTTGQTVKYMAVKSMTNIIPLEKSVEKIVE